MTYRCIASAVLLIASAAALHAQNTTTSNQTNRNATGSVTVTGCVERADQVAGNANIGTTVDSLSFMLIKATKGTAAEARPTATNGQRENAAEKGAMYRLNGETSKLNPHVGHRVEVTGTLDSGPAPAAAATDSTQAYTPSLKVESIKMVSDTCGR